MKVVPLRALELLFVPFVEPFGRHGDLFFGSSLLAWQKAGERGLPAGEVEGRKVEESLPTGRALHLYPIALSLQDRDLLPLGEGGQVEER